MFHASSVTNLASSKPLSSVEAAEIRRRYTQIGLAAGMLLSGAANTLTCKQAFMTTSSGHVFNHPFVQAGAMFTGEVGCMIFYLASTHLRGKRVRWPPLHVLLGFAIPAWCDIIGTSTMYVGLTMTSASTYQMLRGSVVIFTGLMSRVMLRRATSTHQWLGMVLVFSGALVVGSTSVLQTDAPKDGSAPSSFSTILLGDLLVVFSQLFTALQTRRVESRLAPPRRPAGATARRLRADPGLLGPARRALACATRSSSRAPQGVPRAARAAGGSRWQPVALASARAKVKPQPQPLTGVGGA